MQDPDQVLSSRISDPIFFLEGWIRIRVKATRIRNPVTNTIKGKQLELNMCLYQGLPNYAILQ